MAKNRTDSKGMKLPKGISQRENGSYMSRFTVNGQRFTLYDSDLKELINRTEDTKYDLKHGVIDKISRQTLNSFFEDYLSAYVIPRTRETTVESYRNIWNAFVRDTFGKKKVKDITRMQIINSLNKTIREKNPSSGTVRNISSLLYSCFERAVLDGYRPSNPAEKLERDIAKGRKPKTKEALTEEEQQNFLEFIRDSDVFNIYLPLITFMLGTGTRIGEAYAITWEDVDFRGNVVYIRRTISYRRGNSDKMHFIIDEPKTEAGVRTIPLLSEVKEQLIQQRKNRLALGIPNYEVCGISNFVFTTRTGRPYTNAGINAAIKRIIAAYNKQESASAEQEKRQPHLLPDFSCHNTRHTFATRLCQGTNDIKAIQGLLGHSNPKTTLAIYAHVTESQKRASMETLEQKLKLG